MTPALLMQLRESRHLLANFYNASFQVRVSDVPALIKYSPSFGNGGLLRHYPGVQARPTDRSPFIASNAPMAPPETPTKPIILPSISSKVRKSRAFFSTPLKLPWYSGVPKINHQQPSIPHGSGEPLDGPGRYPHGPDAAPNRNHSDPQS